MGRCKRVGCFGDDLAANSTGCRAESTLAVNDTDPIDFSSGLLPPPDALLEPLTQEGHGWIAPFVVP